MTKNFWNSNWCLHLHVVFQRSCQCKTYIQDYLSLYNFFCSKNIENLVLLLIPYCYLLHWTIAKCSYCLVFQIEPIFLIPLQLFFLSFSFLSFPSFAFTSQEHQVFSTTVTAPKFFFVCVCVVTTYICPWHSSVYFLRTLHSHQPTHVCDNFNLCWNLLFT